MLSKCKSLYSMIAFITVQQSFIAASTLFIALAGSSLAEGDLESAYRNLVLFFVASLLGFTSSSIAEIYAEVARRYLSVSYIRLLSTLPSYRPRAGSETNKSSTVAWMSGESVNRLDSVVDHISEGASTVLNVILTLVIFSIVIDYFYTIGLIFSLIVSCSVVVFTRPRIETIGGSIQRSFLSINTHVGRLWDAIFYGSSKLKFAVDDEHSARVRSYFDDRRKYVLLEQFLAACPIVLGVAFTLLILSQQDLSDPSQLGAMVAVLPRTLQLLGSAYAIVVVASRYYLLRKQYSELKHFWERLDELDIMKLGHFRVKLAETGESREVEDFLCDKAGVLRQPGRFTVSGENGSGKSTFLRLLKGLYHDSILIGPTISFLAPEDSGVSTGERQRLNLDLIFEENVRLVLLDEWDANLDDEAVLDYDSKISNLAKQMCVIEVRHKGT